LNLSWKHGAKPLGRGSELLIREVFDNEWSANVELALDSGIDSHRDLERFLEGVGSLVFGKEQ
jgi:hypothetical protein